ncbi:MAG: hypothetical protein Q9163_004873 [Psora crenata]
MLVHIVPGPFHGPMLCALAALLALEGALESIGSSVCIVAIGKPCSNTRNLSDPEPLNTPMIQATDVVPDQVTTSPIPIPPDKMPFGLSILAAILRFIGSYVDLWPVILAYSLCTVLTCLFVRQVFLIRKLKRSNATTGREYDSFVLNFIHLRGRIDKLLDHYKRQKRTIASLQHTLSVDGIVDLLGYVRHLEEAKTSATYQVEALRHWLADLFKETGEQKTQVEALQQQLQNQQGNSSRMDADFQALMHQRAQLRKELHLGNTLREALQGQVRELSQQKLQDESQRQALQRELDGAREVQSRDHNTHQAMRKQLEGLQKTKAVDDSYRSTLETQLTELQKDKSAADKDFLALDASFDELFELRMRAEDKVEDLQSDLDKNRKWLIELEKEHRELQYAHDQLENLYDGVQRRFEGQKITIQNLQAFNRDKEKDIGELCDENDELKRQLEASATDATERLQLQLDVTTREKHEAVEASKAAQVQLELNEKATADQLGELQADKSAANRALDILQEQVLLLEAAQTGADSRNAVLEKQLTGVSQELDQQNQALETGKTVSAQLEAGFAKQLQTLQSQLQEQKDRREKDSKRYKDDYAMLQQRVADHEASIEEAWKISNASTQQSEAHLSEKQVLQSRVEVMAQQVAELRSNQGRDREQHDALRREIEDLKVQNRAASENVQQSNDQMTRMVSAWQEDKATRQSLESQVAELAQQAEEATREKAQLRSTIEAMNAEGMQLQERIRTLELPVDLNFDWDTDPFIESIRNDTIGRESVDGLQENQQGTALPQTSTAVQQYPPTSAEESLLTNSAATEGPSLVQGPSDETAQFLDDNFFDDQWIMESFQTDFDFQNAFGDEATGTNQPGSSHAVLSDPTGVVEAAQPPSADAPYFAQLQADVPQASSSAYVNPSVISFGDSGNMAAGTFNPGPMFNIEDRDDRPQAQFPSADVDFAPIGSMNGLAQASPTAETAFNVGNPQQVGQFRLPQTDFLFSASDAVRAARPIAQPVTRDRALRRRQRDWAARQHQHVQQPSSENQVPEEQPGPSSAPAPSQPRSTGLTFEEPDTSEVERAFADSSMQTTRAQPLVRHIRNEGSESEP